MKLQWPFERSQSVSNAICKVDLFKDQFRGKCWMKLMWTPIDENSYETKWTPKADAGVGCETECDSLSVSHTKSEASMS